MNEPRFDDESPIECAGCGEPFHLITVVNHTPTPLCLDCFDDSTFVCPECGDRYWQVDGVRIYVSPSLYCQDCGKSKQDALQQRWQQRRDEHKDFFHQVRRG